MSPERREDGAGRLAVDELDRLGDAAAVLDVREVGEYERGHIPGATTLARSRIEFDARRTVPGLDMPVVVYDNGEGRAELARQTLLAMGYSNVAVLQGGMSAWSGSGRPVAAGTNVPSKRFGERILHADSVRDIEPADLLEMQGHGRAPLVLDVRTYEEHRRGCIPGAWHLPGGDLIGAVEDLKGAGVPIVTHCAGRTRSLISAATLGALGVPEVRALRNGTMGWQLAGLELESPSAGRRFAASASSRRLSLEEGARLREARGIPCVTPDRVAASVGPGAAEPGYLFDVRGDGEYARGHVPGSVHVPGGQLVQRADDFIAVRGAPVVLVSGTGTRASVTAWWLRRMGLPNVSILLGGIANWTESGFAVTREAREPVAAPPSVATIAPEALAAAIASSEHVIVDIGSSFRYERRHLPGAHWITRGWIELVAPRKVRDTGRSIVLTGAAPSQMAHAAAAFARLGYADVRMLDATVEQWMQAGYPVESGLASCWAEPLDVPNAGILRGDRAAMQRYLDWEVALTDEGSSHGH